jgi:ketosteroid isomerase-like protein
MFSYIGILAACLTSHLQTPAAPLPADIKTRTMDMVRAFKAKDASWLEKNTTSGFVTFDHDKKFNRAQSEQQMQQIFAMTVSVTDVTAKILSFKKVGDSFIVTTTTSFTGTLKGPDGKPGKLLDSSTDDITWVRAGSGWKMSVDKTISEKATFNGKPLTP